MIKWLFTTVGPVWYAPQVFFTTLRTEHDNIHLWKSKNECYRSQFHCVLNKDRANICICPLSVSAIISEYVGICYQIFKNCYLFCICYQIFISCSLSLRKSKKWTLSLSFTVDRIHNYGHNNCANIWGSIYLLVIWIVYRPSSINMYLLLQQTLPDARARIAYFYCFIEKREFY